MENKLPEHIQKLIDQDAENYSRDKESEYSQRSVNAHRDGATAWAKQCQQMAKALESLLKYRSDNGYLKRGLTIGAIRESYEMYNEAILNAETLLATWNEGMEPNKNTTNEHTNKP